MNATFSERTANSAACATQKRGVTRKVFFIADVANQSAVRCKEYIGRNIAFPPTKQVDVQSATCEFIQTSRTSCTAIFARRNRYRSQFATAPMPGRYNLSRVVNMPHPGRPSQLVRAGKDICSARRPRHVRCYELYSAGISASYLCMRRLSSFKDFPRHDFQQSVAGRHSR